MTPARHLVRTRSDRRAVIRNAVEIRVAREEMGRQNRVVAITAKEDGDDRRIRLLESDDHRVRTRRVDTGDVIVTVARQHGVGWTHNCVVCEDDVARGKRCPVLPGNVVAQMIRDAPAVPRYAAILRRRCAHGNAGHDAAATVVGRQIRAGESADHARIVTLEVERVQRNGVGSDRNNQSTVMLRADPRVPAAREREAAQ
jgi:hypothetical protein